MAKGLAGLISVLGAAGAGYARGQQVYEDRQRQNRAEARANEEYEYTKAQRAKTDKLDSDVSAAMADRTVETVTPPDMSGADISMAGQQPPQYKVGDQTYSDEGQARAALQGTNSRAAKYQRAAEAAAQNGTAGMDKAQLYEAFAKRALDEGADKILTGVQSTAPTLDAVKKAGGQVAGVVGNDLADVFNKTGAHWKVSPDTVVQHFIDKDPAGREFVNSRILGKDGKPVVDNVATAGLMLQDMKTRLEAQRANVTAFQTGQQISQAGERIAEDKRHNKAAEDETRRSNIASNGVAWAGVKARNREMDLREKEYQDRTVDGQMANITKALGPLSPEEDKQYRRKLLGFGSSKTVDEAFVNDVVKEWSKNNPQATAGEVANFRVNLTSSLTQASNNKAVETEVHAAFAKNPPGSAGYAQVYNDAKGQLGMTDQQLAAMGYKAPAAAPRPAARVGTAMPTPAAAPAAANPTYPAKGYNEMSPAERAARVDARRTAEAAQAAQDAQKKRAYEVELKAQQLAAVQKSIERMESAQKAGRLLQPGYLQDLYRERDQLQAQ